MSAFDFKSGKLNRNLRSLPGFLRRDNGKVAIIIRKKVKIIRGGEATFSRSIYENPVLLKSRIESIERESRVKFRGWKTQMQPQSHGSRIFLVFS